MAKQLQLRRGTTTQHSTFTGAAGEVTIDTDKKVVVVHDGSTAGGTPSQKELVSGTNIKTVNSNSLLGSGNVAVQETLVSGTNIKSINSSSILASGNLDLVAKVSSTDNAIVRFNGTSGAVQNSSVVIDDSGNVGIGTSSPLSKLMLQSSSGGVELRLNPQNEGTDRAWRVKANTYDGIGYPLTISDYNAERMRIDSSGNVGIGVTPSAWKTNEYKAVQVGIGASFYGRVTAGDGDKAGFSANAFYDHTDDRFEYIATDSASRYDQAGGGHYWYTAPSGTAGNAITFTQAMTLDASGNVGIGTSSPAEKLSILGGNLLIDNDASSKIILGKGADGVDGNCQIGVVQTGSDSDELGLVFKTYDNAAGTSLAVEKMRIDHTGNVGIGTSSPAEKLSILGGNLLIDNDASSKIILGKGADGVDGNCQIGVVQTGSDSDELGLVFKTYDNAAGTSLAVEKMRIDHTGNVGIGTNIISSGLHIIKPYSVDTDGATNKWTARFKDSTSMATGVGGSLLFQGDKGGGATGNFAGIAGLKENATSGNEQGYLGFYTTTSTGVITERMRIDSAGDVGIGTSSPSYQLQLSQNSAAKPTSNTWTIASDERLKENIVLADLDRCYEIVKNIPLKHYAYKTSVFSDEQTNDRSKLGWIAQEVKEYFPKAVEEKPLQLATYTINITEVEEQKLISEAVEATYDEEGNELTQAVEAVFETITVKKEEKVYDVMEDALSLDSDQLYAVMYGAIQKLQLTVELLTARIEALEAK